MKNKCFMDKLSTKEQSISQKKKSKRTCIKRTAAFLKNIYSTVRTCFTNKPLPSKKKNHTD